MIIIKPSKQNMFDRLAVVSAVDAGTRRILTDFGRFVRRTARFSMRRRKDASQPGTPPSVHTGLLRQLILYAYDPSSRSVVIGPRLLRRGSIAARTTEEGGVVERKKRRGGVATLKYPARPYMRPAFQKELQGKLAKQLEGFVKP